MSLKDRNWQERVVKVESEVGTLVGISERISGEVLHLREDFSGMRDEFFKLREDFSGFSARLGEILARLDRLEQRMDKLMWWVLGVMFALLIAVIFKH